MTPVQETFSEALEFTSDYTARTWPNVIKHFDPVLIEEALAATGTATIRKRRLPAERTVWLMLGMSVMRDLPIAAVARQDILSEDRSTGTASTFSEVAAHLLVTRHARDGAVVAWRLLAGSSRARLRR